MDFLGIKALASRTKRISDSCFEQVKSVYDALSVPFEPTWYPYVMFVEEAGNAGIGEIVQALGVSQPATSAMVKKLVEQGIFNSVASEGDARARVVTLTSYGKELINSIQPIVKAIEKSLIEVDKSIACQNDIIRHISMFEDVFKQISLKQRALNKLVGMSDIRTVPYEKKWQSFYEIHNRAWLERYFRVEPYDDAMLKDPETHILSKGGHIYIVCLGEYPVGGFSLIERGNKRFELGKMYVPFALQGLGLGRQVLLESIATAKKLGADSLYLLSNRSLAPAIHLYRTHGFVEQALLPEDNQFYERADIRMEMKLTA